MCINGHVGKFVRPCAIYCKLVQSLKIINCLSDEHKFTVFVKLKLFVWKWNIVTLCEVNESL